jgi:hypothetical protein
MEAFLTQFLGAAQEMITRGFKVIFPESPGVGIYVVGLCAVLFLFYLFKSGFRNACKISLMSLAGLIFLLFSIHSLNKIFHLSLSF